VLVFANPGLEGRGAATTTLMANLQIINPGEIARTHRHTPSAFRLIVEGTGAYTTVEGEKTYMDPGDFITTLIGRGMTMATRALHPWCGWMAWMFL
jgi:gentisate 1,2-dioxygenase